MLSPKLWWTNHGTKILGFFTSAVATISFIDQETVKIIGATVGETYAHIILIASGLATAYRGWTNSNKQKQ